MGDVVGFDEIDARRVAAVGGKARGWASSRGSTASACRRASA
jgi:hypothetical protein